MAGIRYQTDSSAVDTCNVEMVFVNRANFRVTWTQSEGESVTAQGTSRAVQRLQEARLGKGSEPEEEKKTE
jgi:hypothetical protein